jgi:hypothetical protein
MRKPGVHGEKIKTCRKSLTNFNAVSNKPRHEDEIKICFGGVIFKNASLLSYNICFEFQNVHLHIMEITVNNCVPVDLVLFQKNIEV